SDHGLCGSYHEQLADLVQVTHEELAPHAMKFLCVGGRLYQALADRQIHDLELLMPPASDSGIGRLASQLVQRIERFSAGAELSSVSVRLLFMQRRGHGMSEPSVDTLLPVPQRLFRPPAQWPSRALPMFTLDEASLLSSLLRNYLFVRLYRASAEALVTENAARLALMQQAEQAVSERLTDLDGTINQLRQEEITTEIMDIITAYLAET